MQQKESYSIWRERERDANLEMVALPLQQGLCLSAKEHLGTARAFCLQKLPGRVRLASRKPAMNVRCGESSGHRNGIGDSDGIIIVDHGSRSQDSNLMLNSFVAMFKEKTGYAIVEPAHMQELAKPSIEDAFYVCVQQGAKRIIVSPFFLSPGRHWKQDIPNLASEAAKNHPGISFMVTAPLGLHELLVDIMNDRIRYCLSHVAGYADECAYCRGTGKCREISM
ncbi:sirohydrochlorin ferrochelatase, chloroplastic isoform X3 [Nymphaea colorata]|uniref:sirohydrochlorin ferrochelatase, chloroplastic isoform X2 n=1 Tax=Nymphaea colorata TaxID=210225 RepID=UPI00129E062E|nr:sirohydrochlorin ferrochelatase, chloroplastic isoform X2 [Nymphaea colorata]XP_031500541.1 sirohydrochlorin ferrochelatase, chloroplastic isoform X3 [Nymphaea colorata]